MFAQNRPLIDYVALREIGLRNYFAERNYRDFTAAFYQASFYPARGQHVRRQKYSGNGYRYRAT